MSLHTLLDARHLAPAADDGAGRVMAGLLAHLPAALRPSERVTVLCAPPARPRIRALLGGTAQVATLPCPVPPASLAQHTALSDWIRAVGPDVFHYPQFDAPLVPRETALSAYIHDVTPLVVPGYFGPGRGYRRAAAAALYASTLARADAVLVNSQATLADVRALGCRMPPATVAYPGAPAAAGLPCPHASPTFVYVGNHRPHKNLAPLLRGFARFAEDHPDARLHLVGRADPRFTAVAPLAQRTPGVVQHDGLDDAAVRALLRTAWALCFPSPHEGFGFPVLEAAALGVPAAIARGGALAEIAGDGALVVEAPRAARAWHDALSALLAPALRTTLAAAAVRNRARFTWTAHAQHTVQAWRHAAHTRAR